MDIDDIHQTRVNSNLACFDQSPANFAWRHPRSEQILRRREALTDSLIFDVLLRLGGIHDCYAVYPPYDETSLKHLLELIETSSYDTLKKSCLVYYLLKWCQDGSEEKYREEQGIPPQFAALADAYWHLDSGINVPRAVALLSDLRLNRDHTSKIIHAISLSPNSAPLIRKYVQNAKPPLIEPPDLDAYTIALAEFSLLEAWQFQRTFSEVDGFRSRLFNKILEWCLMPEPRASALKQLIALPFSPYEISLLHSYASEPPKLLSTIAVATLQDLVCVRLVQSGSYAEAIKMDRKFSASTTKNSKYTQGRTQMIQELYNALPSVERELLDVEPEAYIPPTQNKLTASPRKAPANGDVSMSQSWDSMPEFGSVSRGINKSPVRPAVSHPTPIVPSPNRGASQQNTALNFPALNLGAGTSSARNSFPLPLIPVSNSPLAAPKPRHSLSGVGNRLALGSTPTFSSPLSGLKLGRADISSPPRASTSTNVFNSAGRQRNAFFQPPPEKPKAFKSLFNPEPISVDSLPAEEDINMGVAESTLDEPGRKSPQNKETEHVPELRFSVFGNEVNEEMNEDKPQPQTKRRAPQKRGKKKSFPGAFGSENDLDDDDLNAPASGSLMTDEEENDQIAPLRAPSPPAKRTRRARSIAPSETGDESEGVITRRRSSRLTTTSNTQGLPEPTSASMKTKKSKSGATRKKRQV